MLHLTRGLLGPISFRHWVNSSPPAPCTSRKPGGRRHHSGLRCDHRWVWRVWDISRGPCQLGSGSSPDQHLHPGIQCCTGPRRCSRQHARFQLWRRRRQLCRGGDERCGAVWQRVGACFLVWGLHACHAGLHPRRHAACKRPRALVRRGRTGHGGVEHPRALPWHCASQHQHASRRRRSPSPRRHDRGCQWGWVLLRRHSRRRR